MKGEEAGDVWIFEEASTAGACARCLARSDGADECIGCKEWAGRLRKMRNILRESRNFLGKRADHISTRIVCALRIQNGSRR